MSDEMKIRTRLCKPKFKRSVLTIPGTHGTWADHRIRGISKTGAMYVRTKPTRQVSYFLTWGWQYVKADDGTKVRVH